MRKIFTPANIETFTGSAQYDFDLPKEVSRLDFDLVADGNFSLYLLKGDNRFIVYSGQQLKQQVRVADFDGLSMRTDKKVMIGGSILIQEDPEGERLDPQKLNTVVRFKSPQNVDAQVRRSIARTLEAMGLDQSQSEELDLSPLHGDFSDEDGDFADPLVEEFLQEGATGTDQQPEDENDDDENAEPGEDDNTEA